MPEVAAAQGVSPVRASFGGMADVCVDGVLAQRLLRKHHASCIRLEVADAREFAAQVNAVGGDGRKHSVCRKRVLMRRDTGQVYAFQFDAEFFLFYRVSRDRVLVLMVNREWVQLWVTPFVDPLPTNGSHGYWAERYVVNQTGNHRPRRRVVKVPTGAGEPVRG